MYFSAVNVYFIISGGVDSSCSTYIGRIVCIYLYLLAAIMDIFYTQLGADIYGTHGSKYLYNNITKNTYHNTI